MFTVRPPLPSPEDLQSFRLDAEAMRAAVKLRATISAQVFLLRPETLLALARQFFPGENYFQAISKFGLEAVAALRELTQHGEDVCSLSKAENDRLAPLVAEAARRSFEIVRKLEGVSNALRFIDADIIEREASLRKAGVKGEDLARVMADGAEDREARRTALNDERTALLAQQGALSDFLKSGNERHLPEGFSIVEVPRISARDALRNHVETRWAA